MKAVERVGVKHLKNNLSAYLRRVKRGVRVLVTDRNEVIAEIGKPSDILSEGVDPLLVEWIAAEKLRPATAPKRKLDVSPVRLASGTAQQLIDADRGE